MRAVVILLSCHADEPTDDGRRRTETEISLFGGAAGYPYDPYYQRPVIQIVGRSLSRQTGESRRCSAFRLEFRLPGFESKSDAKTWRDFVHLSPVNYAGRGSFRRPPAAASTASRPLREYPPRC